jgi:hypothetical protein
MRHCAASWKVAGLIPDGVTGNFHWHTFSGHSMAVGLTQPLNRNEYQELFLGGKGGWCTELKTLPPSCADCLEIWEPQPPGTLRAFQACNGIASPFTKYRIFPSIPRTLCITRTQYFPFSRTFLIDTAHLMYTAHLKIHGIVRLAVARPVFRYFGIFSILIA